MEKISVIKKIIILGVGVLVLLLSFVLFILKSQFHSFSPSNIKKDIDVNKVYESLQFSCSDIDKLCIKVFLEDLTKQYGPEVTLNVLSKLIYDKKVSKKVDLHQLAHLVGRKTAQTFGYNSDAFLLCPMTAFNGGCQHGFFEHVLGEKKSAKEAAETICRSLDDKKFSEKFIFYCYHGVGHGVMMSQSYNLSTSLKICDQMNSQLGQEGCWQGVFMENIAGKERGETRVGNFSDTDPLAPCNIVDEKYRKECYVNIPGNLLSFYKGSLSRSVDACLEAGKFQEPCVQGLGIYTTDQVNIGLGTLKNSSIMCNDFPSSVRIYCYKGALENLLNVDFPKIERAVEYCESDTKWSKHECYKEIGVDLKLQTASLQQKKELCSQVEKGFQKDCLEGVR